ncbi:hypothetical protein C8J38_102587 [Rhizobium sp. PP-WC-2G-219]|nr:hypothetical protein DFI02_102115 [Rhizobium sp. PP-F2F-G20b]TCL94157.1 hypothetical protein C8J38_102587 [Rhizobium sp. PP-WC-2G-219]
MDVVCYGQSLDEPDSYYLVRAYDHLDHLTRSQRDFYQSDAWKAGPRTEIIACIATSLKSVISMTDEAIDAIR